MANINKPPRKNRSALDAPPVLIETTGATRGKLKDLNLKVEPELHKRLKKAAAELEMSMVDIVKASLGEWLDRHAGNIR